MSPEQMKVYEHKNMLRNGMLRGTYTWHDAIVPYRIIERDYGNQSFSFKRSLDEIIFRSRYDSADQASN